MHFTDGSGAARRFAGSGGYPAKDLGTRAASRGTSTGDALTLDATGALAGDLIPDRGASRWASPPLSTADAEPMLHLIRAWTGESTR